MIVLKENNLGGRIAEALKSATVYLGDSESLVSVIPKSVCADLLMENIDEGQEVAVNSLFRFDFIKNKSANEKGVVLYMQDDPCADNAVLERYIAPLKQEGDNYKPLNFISFVCAKEGFVVKGNRLHGIFCEEKQTETVIQKSKPRKKKKV